MSPMCTPVNQPLSTNSSINLNMINCKMGFIWGIITILSESVGLLADVWLLWVLVQRQRSGMTEIYMLNLTIMSMIVSLVTVPFSLSGLLGDDEFPSIASIFYHCCGNGQPLFMVCICVDCYMAVVHPVTYMKLKQHTRYRQVNCGLVWGLSVAAGFLFTYIKDAATSSFRVMPYILSLPTIVFCNLSVLHALRKPDPSGRSDVHPQKQRALQIITNSLIVTSVAYFPPLVVFLLLTPLPLSSEVKYCYIIGFILLPPLVGSTIMSLLSLQNMGVQKTLKSVLCVLKRFK